MATVHGRNFYRFSPLSQSQLAARLKEEFGGLEVRVVGPHALTEGKTMTDRQTLAALLDIPAVPRLLELILQVNAARFYEDGVRAGMATSREALATLFNRTVHLQDAPGVDCLVAIDVRTRPEVQTAIQELHQRQEAEQAAAAQATAPLAVTPAPPVELLDDLVDEVDHSALLKAGVQPQSAGERIPVPELRGPKVLAAGIGYHGDRDQKREEAGGGMTQPDPDGILPHPQGTGEVAEPGGFRRVAQAAIARERQGGKDAIPASSVSSALPPDAAALAAKLGRQGGL
jgi:hypothetical protein